MLKDAKFDQIAYLGKDQKHVKFSMNSNKLEFKAF
jgi:hypothetical protein